MICCENNDLAIEILIYYFEVFFKNYNMLLTKILLFYSHYFSMVKYFSFVDEIKPVQLIIT